MSTRNPLFDDFKRTIIRLEEVLKLRKNAVIRDSAIKRFELCFDLAWKCIQTHARKEGLECHSPRSCLKTAVQLGLIEHDTTWLAMLEDRNLSVHLYKEKFANEIYKRLTAYAGSLKELSKKLD